MTYFGPPKLLQMAKVALQKLLHILLVMLEARFRKMEPLFAASHMILLATTAVPLTKLQPPARFFLVILEQISEVWLIILQLQLVVTAQVFASCIRSYITGPTTCKMK